MAIKIVQKKISEIKPYANNPRINDDAVNAVRHSIKEFGFKVPIVLDKQGVVVTGHTRLRAAKELKLKTVPCVIADDLTEEQIKAFRVADNKTAELSTWDFDKLGEELEGMTLDLSEFGFSSFELDMMKEDYTPEEYDEELIKEYSEHAEDQLKFKRVIINYTDEQEEALKKILGVDTLKVLMKFEDLDNDGSEK